MLILAAVLFRWNNVYLFSHLTFMSLSNKELFINSNITILYHHSVFTVCLFIPLQNETINSSKTYLPAPVLFQLFEFFELALKE